MLILFDIDGTLLLTEGAGVAAMQDAGRELFGAHFSTDGVEFSGRLDPLIWIDLAQRNGVNDHNGAHDRFRAAYRRHLQRRLAGSPTATALPGVRQLIDALLAEGIGLGLLTGNYPETGRIKLESAGIDPDAFAVHAWGCDGPTRRDLPPIALRQYCDLRRRSLGPEHVVVIGDTPHDVDCARVHGCRSLGVATGAFTIEALRAAGADLALADLSDTPHIVNWLLKSGPAVRQ